MTASSDSTAGDAGPMTDVERLLAFQEIRQLADRYAIALDARDLAALADLYVPDVRATKADCGRDALIATFDAAMRTVGVTFLHVGNHQIDIDPSGDTATGIVYCRAEIQDGGPDGDRWIVQTIQYHDRYERRDGRWYFATMRGHLLVYGAELGQNPVGLPAANWPQNQTGWGSVPHDLPSWQDFWS